MPQQSSLEVARRIDGWWERARRDLLSDPFGAMAKAGLFQIGLPGAGGALDSYRAVATAEQAIAAKTGLLGLASAFAARQMTARFFIAGFANQDQRALWLPRIAAGEVCAAIAISEPGAGAHPKHLQTAAEPDGSGFVIHGRKAWVTNGPVADLFLVLAVAALEDGRKRYGLFMVPKQTPGLVIKPMTALDALAPATHCELELDGCKVPASARVGDMPDAYPAMALPFRDIEDTVGTANVSGLLSWLLEKAAAQTERTEENALRLGRIAGLVSLVHAASQLAVAALDGEGQDVPARVIGVRLLARDIVGEIRELLGQGPPADEAVCAGAGRVRHAGLGRARAAQGAANQAWKFNRKREPGMNTQLPADSIEAVTRGLASAGYIASRQIATAVYLAQQIEKPILVEGPAGVGKTELAKALAAWRGLKMIRLQCYEGLDEAKALYEWKYAKQLLYTQILKDKLGEVLGGADDAGCRARQAARFRRRVLLQGVRRAAAAAAGAGTANGLRAADRRDRQVGRRIRIAAAGNPQRLIRSRSPNSAPSSAIVPPTVILTSNSERDLCDALKRRCLHLHIGFPEQKLEERIVESRVPGIFADAAQADRRLHQRGPHARSEEAAVGQRDHRLGPRAGAAAGERTRP